MNLTDTTLRKLILEELRGIIRVENMNGKMDYISITDEPTQVFKTSQAVDTFNKFYRSLDSETRYFFLEWLRSQLVKRLTPDEIISLTSKVASSVKGNTEPKNPNQK